MSPRSVLVVGAGIGGLAVAIGLRQVGCSVIVLEQASELSEVGAGVQLGPNATKALRALGALEAVEDTAFRPQAIELRDGTSGALLSSEALGEVAEHRYGSPYLQVHRADLHEALLARACAIGVDVRLASMVAKVDFGDGGCRVTCSDGTVHSADAVIGADGLRSAVRTALFGADAPRFTGQIAWRALVPADHVGTKTLPPTACAWTGDHSHFVHYFLRQGRLINLVGITEHDQPGPEDWNEAGAKADLVAAFGHWAGPVRELVNATIRCHRWPLYDRAPIAQWSRGPVTLLGDACHPMLPFLAQGAAMALEDAVVLAACVQEADFDFPRAFQSYENARRPRTSRVQAASCRNATLFHLKGAFLRHSLGAMLEVGRFVAPGKLSLRQDWLYGYDPTGLKLGSV